MNAVLRDIHNQPASLTRVIAHQFGDGAADLRAAAAILRQARRVVFTGMGSSLFASIPAACFLSSRGIAAETVETSELLYFHGRSLAPDTAVVLVSRSGETVEITRLLPSLKQAGIPFIAVTNEPGSSLARDAANTILVKSDPDKLIAIQTYTGTLTALLLLAAAVVDVPLSPAPLVPAVAEAVRRSLDEKGQWASFLSEARVVYLLGRGPSLASVHEGALLFNEAARTPSVPISVAQFRHGPVEVIDERFRAVVFSSGGPTADLDRSLASDVESLGGRVRISSGDGAPFPFAPVLEIVPVEVAVCAMAEARGFEPGNFRFATQVTSTETGFAR